MTLVPHTLRFWLATVAALLVFAITFSLGQWQLRRAAQKQLVYTSVAGQSSRPKLDNISFLALENPVDAVHRPVQLKGVWQSNHTLFLDNRSMDGKSGFFVVTPLALEGSSLTLLVQRGWVQRDFTDRTRLPAIATPSGVVTVQGRIAPSPSKLYEFQGVESGRIRQNVDINGFASEISLPLLPVSLLQTGAASDGVLRNWAAPNLGVEKNYGYAFQWFALSVLTVFLYVWFQLIQPIRLEHRTIPLSVETPSRRD